MDTREEVIYVVVKKVLSRDEQISKEKRRLNLIYKNVPKENKGIIEGLIQRAAYMRITLEWMEVELDEKGYVEMFTQSEKTEPYERERPIARLYNTMNKNYQSIIKQLSDLVPKQEVKIKDDNFDNFINGRDG
jgi:hypothetical protein